jgi:hypothetical protein
MITINFYAFSIMFLFVFRLTYFHTLLNFRMTHFTVAMGRETAALCSSVNDRSSYYLTHSHAYASGRVRSDKLLGMYDDKYDWDRYFIVQVGLANE